MGAVGISSFFSAHGDDPFCQGEGFNQRDDLEAGRPDVFGCYFKAYCDKVLSESRKMEEARLGEFEKLSSSIDTKTAKSAQLKRGCRVVDIPSASSLPPKLR